MKSSKKKKIKFNWKRLAENKGFYIALAAVVFVVGFYVYGRYAQESLENDVVTFDDEAWQEAVNESGITVIDVDEPKDTPIQAEKNTEKVQVPQAQQKTSLDNVTAAQEAAVETMAEEDGTFAMIMPCEGKITAECSLEELVYCAAMEDWRTHNGMDIAAAEGDPVKAAESGIVSRVYEDEFLGIVVEVDHKNGISSLYGNLQSLDFISAGTSVSRGDIIGGVGKPGTLEQGDGPHLHFEVMADGAYKNPVELLDN